MHQITCGVCLIATIYLRLESEWYHSTTRLCVHVQCSKPFNHNCLYINILVILFKRNNWLVVDKGKKGFNLLSFCHHLSQEIFVSFFVSNIYDFRCCTISGVDFIDGTPTYVVLYKRVTFCDTAEAKYFGISELQKMP